MVLLSDLQTKKENICVVGLGYVGLPLAVLLAKHFNVIGFDIDASRITQLESGHDKTGEVRSDVLSNTAITFTSDPKDIAQAKFIIIAVPTPVNTHNIPDLSLVKKATNMVAEHITGGSIVVYESTVYPGVTEEICGPILEAVSGLHVGTDVWLGYSPERVNPGDTEHTIDRVVKVVSGCDKSSEDIIAGVYGAVTNIFRAKSIKVAEAAKAIENTQRDLNIALMNELAVLFSKMDISVYDVLDAAKTKWNFLPFVPGLVGGHCIGVDPYYLTYKALEVGHHPEVILAGRGMNDSMHIFIAHEIIKEMTRLGKDVTKANIVIFGATFKENVPDVRNSKVIALYKELCNFGLAPVIYDPHADTEVLKEEYGITLTEKDALPKADTLVLAVPHKEFVSMTISDLKDIMNHDNLLLFDIKRIFQKEEVEKSGIHYWTL